MPRALAGDKERIKAMRRRTTIDKHGALFLGFKSNV